MFFRSSHIRKHQRYAYLQFITFFSLGPQVAEGSRCAICVDLSDSGICMYTPDRLHKGQAILFNNPLPFHHPKATVRWVKEYRIAGHFCKSGVMLSSRAEDDSSRKNGDLKDPSPGDVEKRSSLIEGGNFAFPGGNCRVASSDDFWSNLAELSEKEAGQFIALTSEVMLHEAMKDDVWLRFLRAIAFFRKAGIISGRQGNSWNNNTLDLVEKSLIDFRASGELGGNDERFTHNILEENRDAAAKALEGERPGRAQEILGKTKLAYFGDRLYFRSRQYAPSDEEMKIFGNIFFHYSGIVRSAEIFYKVLGEPGKRYINVLLYKETSPRNAAGEAIDPLCIIGLVEDGTFHLVKDFAASAPDAEVGEEGAEDGGPLYGKLSSQETGGNSNRRKAKLLMAGTVLLLLMITLFFLKSRQPKSVSEPEKGVMAGQHPVLNSHLVSGSPDNPSSITQGSGSSAKVEVHKSLGAPAEGGTGRRKKRPQKTEANEEGQITTGRGRTTGTPPPEIRKRSFPPHSRDDL